MRIRGTKSTKKLQIFVRKYQNLSVLTVLNFARRFLAKIISLFEVFKTSNLRQKFQKITYAFNHWKNSSREDGTRA